MITYVAQLPAVIPDDQVLVHNSAVRRGFSAIAGSAPGWSRRANTWQFVPAAGPPSWASTTASRSFPRVSLPTR